MKNLSFIFLLSIILIGTVAKSQFLFPKKIWLYWSGPESSMQLLAKLCYQNILKKAAESNWQVNLVNDENLPQYIQSEQIQKLETLHQSSKCVSVATRSDMIRLLLIQKHGGLWLDITTILLEGLDWLEKIGNNSQFITNKHPNSSHPEVIFTYSPSHQHREEFWDGENRMNAGPGYESFFILAQPRARIITEWKEKLIQHYPLTYYEIRRDLKDHQVYLPRFGENPYHKCYFSLYMVLQDRQKELDRQINIFKSREQRVTSSVYYKIWSFSCLIGPCLMWNYHDEQNLLGRKTVSEAAEKMGTLSFFIKVTHFKDGISIRKILSEQQIKGKRDPQSIKQLYFANHPEVNEGSEDFWKSCQQVTYIVQNSYLANFIQQTNHSHKIKIFSQHQRQQWQRQCQEKKTKLNNESSVLLGALQIVKNLSITSQGLIFLIVLTSLFYIGNKTNKKSSPIAGEQTQQGDQTQQERDGQIQQVEEFEEICQLRQNHKFQQLNKFQKQKDSCCYLISGFFQFLGLLFLLFIAVRSAFFNCKDTHLQSAFTLLLNQILRNTSKYFGQKIKSNQNKQKNHNNDDSQIKKNGSSSDKETKIEKKVKLLAYFLNYCQIIANLFIAKIFLTHILQKVQDVTCYAHIIGLYGPLLIMSLKASLSERNKLIHGFIQLITRIPFRIFIIGFLLLLIPFPNILYIVSNDSYFIQHLCQVILAAIVVLAFLNFFNNFYQSYQLNVKPSNKQAGLQKEKKALKQAKVLMNREQLLTDLLVLTSLLVYKTICYHRFFDGLIKAFFEVPYGTYFFIRIVKLELASRDKDSYLSHYNKQKQTKNVNSHTQALSYVREGNFFEAVRFLEVFSFLTLLLVLISENYYGKSGLSTFKSVFNYILYKFLFLVMVAKFTISWMMLGLLGIGKVLSKKSMQI